MNTPDFSNLRYIFSCLHQRYYDNIYPGRFENIQYLWWNNWYPCIYYRYHQCILCSWSHMISCKCHSLSIKCLVSGSYTKIHTKMELGLQKKSFDSNHHRNRCYIPLYIQDRMSFSHPNTFGKWSSKVLVVGTWC